MWNGAHRKVPHPSQTTPEQMREMKRQNKRKQRDVETEQNCRKRLGVAALSNRFLRAGESGGLLKKRKGRCGLCGLEHSGVSVWLADLLGVTYAKKNLTRLSQCPHIGKCQVTDTVWRNVIDLLSDRKPAAAWESLQEGLSADDARYLCHGLAGIVSQD